MIARNGIRRLGPGRWLPRIGAICLTSLVVVLSLMPNISVPDSAPNNTDLAIHLAMHGATGFALLYAWHTWPQWVLPSLAVLVIALEVGQIWVPGRSFSVADLATNVVGAALGVALVIWIFRRFGVER